MDGLVAYIVTTGGVLALVAGVYAVFVWGITRFVEERDEE